ncbi:poly(U)-specific 3'-to-5' RNA exonuclease [Rhodotorula kratochvilovae]
MSSEPPKKKRKLPALDASFDEAPRRSDSPELNQGRKRAVPHQRGLWAAHVYLERLSKILKRATADAEAAAPEGATVHSLLAPPPSSAPTGEDTAPSAQPNASTDSALHLSLSRPLMLQTNQRADLRAAVARVAGSCAGFSARYASFAVLENDDKSRRFLGVEIGQGYDALLGLVRKLDGELATLRLPMYYPSPRFHTSLAWTTSTTASSPSPPFSDALLEDLEQRLGKKLRLEGEVFAAEVCVKVGKDVARYRLAGAAAARDGL